MRRVIAVLAMMLVLLLAACSGGGGDTPNDQVSQLRIVMLSATPLSGPSPLRVTFTANITGGLAPYFYSWDFTNDGAADRFLNNEFQRTVSVQQDYFARASDPGGVSQYQAVMKVMDSEGTELTSDPITIVVGTGGFTIDPVQSRFITDNILDGEYFAQSGEPVTFVITPVGGVEPYHYQWDFDEDGNIDSTVQRPQYTWVNPTNEVMIQLVRGTVVDDTGNRAVFDFVVPVYGGDEIPPPNIDFDIILNTSPPAIGDVVTIQFDPTGVNESVPIEPQLDLAVIVDPQKPGVPPYEYYWDFESDGAFDSLVVSPTIPYYDDVRKIFVNPYLHNLSSKTYTLRVMVIDSEGNVRQITRTIVSRNIGGTTGTINLSSTYGVTSVGGAYIAPAGVTPPVPYGLVTDQNTSTAAKFEFTIAGSTGTYEYQFDSNGDGTPDVPAGGGWQDVTGASGITVTENATYLGPGYFPAKLTVRSVDASNNEVDKVTLYMPLSLVVRSEVQLTNGVIKSRYDHGMAASWVSQAGGGNGSFLASREICIIGGAQGSTPLRDVERIVQTYAAPAGAGQFEQFLDGTATARLPLNQERRGPMVWTLDPDGAAVYYVHGGENLINGILASVEASPGGNAGAGAAWTILSEIRAPEYYPLREMSGSYITGVGMLFAGGVHPPSGSDSDNVSGRLIAYDDAFDAYGNLNKPMMTERYDACTVYVNSRLYVIGGRVASGQSVATVEAFNLNTNQWELGPPLQKPRSGAVCQVIGGRVYVIGGAYYPSDESARTLEPTAEVLDPLTGVWSYTLSTPVETAVNNAASVAVPGPGSVTGGNAVINTLFMMGGENDGGQTNRMYEFVYLYTVAPPAV